MALVSVIIPTFRRRELVRRAVISVLSQTYKGIECIVVDDHSLDNTAGELWREFGDDPRFTVIVQTENRHASAARNTGIANARGDYVAFLDDDDVWLEDKLEAQVMLLDASSASVGFCYCWMDIYRGTQRIGGRHPTLRGNVFEDLLLRQPLGNCSTLLVRREALDRVGWFDESLPRGNDGDLIRRLAKCYEVEVVPRVLVCYHVDHEGHPRITGVDVESIRKGIRGQEAKLRKFEADYASRPAVHSALLLLVATQYGLAGEPGPMLVRCRQAIGRTPCSIRTWMGASRAIFAYIRHSVLRPLRSTG